MSTPSNAGFPAKQSRGGHEGAVEIKFALVFTNDTNLFS